MEVLEGREQSKLKGFDVKKALNMERRSHEKTHLKVVLSLHCKILGVHLVCIKMNDIHISLHILRKTCTCGPHQQCPVAASESVAGSQYA